MLSMKELVIVSNLRLISRADFILSWIVHEKRFITSGPGLIDFHWFVMRMLSVVMFTGKSQQFNWRAKYDLHIIQSISCAVKDVCSVIADLLMYFHICNLIYILSTILYNDIQYFE